MARKPSGKKPAPRKRAPKKQTIAKRMAVGVRSLVMQGQPGGWATDHLKESEKYTGWNYVAIKAKAVQVSQADCSVYDDKENPEQKQRKRRLFKSRFGSVAKAYQEGIDEAQPLAGSHPLVQLMKRPNPLQSGASFRYEQTLQLELTGVCLVWNAPNGFGKAVERYVLPSGLTYPVQPSAEFPDGAWRVDQYAGALGAWFGPVIDRYLDAREVQIIRWPHPLTKQDGYSPTSAGALWLDTAEMVDRARWSHLNRGADPSLVITLPDDIRPTEEELEAASNKFNSKYAGPDKAGAAVFVTGSKVEKVSQTAEEMAYTGGHEQLRDAQLALHGVSGVLVGKDIGAYAALYAAIKKDQSLTIAPICNLLAEEDTEWLCRAGQYGDGLTVELEPCGIDDPAILEEQLRTDIDAGAIEVNELRAIRGRQPKDYGDEPAGKREPQLGLDGKPIPQELPPQPASKPKSFENIFAIAKAVHGHELSRKAGLGQLKLLCGLSEVEAESVLGPAVHESNGHGGRVARYLTNGKAAFPYP